jgi:phenylacetate-CoA ligase
MFYDKLDNQPVEKREAALFKGLRQLLEYARPKAPALKAQLKGFEIKSLKDRAALAEVPVLRKSDLLAMQEGKPPVP